MEVESTAGVTANKHGRDDDGDDDEDYEYKPQAGEMDTQPYFGGKRTHRSGQARSFT